MEHIQRRITDVAAWPPAESAEGTAVAFEPALRRAAAIMNSRRVIAVWEDELRPVLNVADCAGDGATLDKRAGLLPEGFDRSLPPNEFEKRPQHQRVIVGKHQGGSTGLFHNTGTMTVTSRPDGAFFIRSGQPSSSARKRRDAEPSPSRTISS